MKLEDFLSALDIRRIDRYLSVKTSRTEDSFIQYVHTVGSCKNYDSLIRSESIHLYKELVQSLLTLVMSTAKSCTSLSGNGIDLIYKYDTWCVLLCLCKKISHSRCTDTDEHLHEV